MSFQHLSGTSKLPLPKAKSSYSKKGKTGESLLEDRFTEVCKVQTRAFYRLPDAHAGSMKATLADFMFIDSGSFFLFECKETKEEHRLPYGNFDVDQVARMRLWDLAGTKCYVMIYHSTLEAWRCFPLKRFMARPSHDEEGKKLGSWFFTEADCRPMPLKHWL